MKYTGDYLGNNGMTSESEVLIQIEKRHGDNLLNKQNLLEHKEMLKKIKELKVSMYFR